MANPFTNESRENESWLEKIWNYLKSLFEPEPRSLQEMWDEDRPRSPNDPPNDPQTAWIWNEYLKGPVYMGSSGHFIL